MKFELTYRSETYRVWHDENEYFLTQEWDENDGGGSGDIYITDTNGNYVTEQIENEIKEGFWK